MKHYLMSTPKVGNSLLTGNLKCIKKKLPFKILYLLNHVVMFKALYSVFFIYLFRMVAIWIQTNRLEKLQHL